MAGTSAALLGGEVYHYHTKLMMKEPFTGGAFVWHQDYVRRGIGDVGSGNARRKLHRPPALKICSNALARALPHPPPPLVHRPQGYWYKNSCMFPDMLTAFIAVDKCTVDNGCMTVRSCRNGKQAALPHARFSPCAPGTCASHRAHAQVLRGSHRAGRIEHIMVGGQTGADMERVGELAKVRPKGQQGALAAGQQQPGGRQRGRSRIAGVYVHRKPLLYSPPFPPRCSPPTGWSSTPETAFFSTATFCTQARPTRGERDTQGKSKGIVTPHLTSAHPRATHLCFPLSAPIDDGPSSVPTTGVATTPTRSTTTLKYVERPLTENITQRGVPTT